MCMMYEQEYGNYCFDMLLYLIQDLLLEKANVEIKDYGEYHKRLLELLDKMHEDKIIIPGINNG